MFKYKQLVIGFVIGAVLFSLAPVSAAIEEYILYKADYKVVINGTEYKDEKLPILNYKGNTYVPFRSMLQAAGLNVEWNAKLQQAEVSPTAVVKSANESEVVNMPEKITQTPDGITQIDTWEGKQYIGWLYIHNKIKEKGYDFFLNTEIRPFTWQITKDDATILDNVPTTMLEGFGYNAVDVDYYINTILPLIQ